MNLFADATTGNTAGQLIASVILAALAVYWLLPKPRGRSIAFGTFSAIAAVIVLVPWILRSFGDPARGLVEQVLFWLFTGGAVLFATIFVTQRNPARGAIAFAFVILSVCGLFLLLAAPFLMAATIIIYMGAIIVTFLFVLMLSHTEEISDENDRTREPFLGSLAGFAFLGLILFTLLESSPSASIAASDLPAQPLTFEERRELLAISEQLRQATATTNKDELLEATKELRDRFNDVLGVTPTELDVAGPATKPQGLSDRLKSSTAPQMQSLRKQATELRDYSRQTFNEVENVALQANAPADQLTRTKQSLEVLRERTLMLAGRGDLPARNVANLGYLLYTDYLLAVEMAGSILLVATIGAVVIAGRKGAPA